MIISEMQGKLATWANEDGGRRFDRLLRLIANRSWLQEAARMRSVLNSVYCAICEILNVLSEGKAQWRSRTRYWTS